MGGIDTRAGAQHFEHPQSKQADKPLIDHVDRGEVHPEAAVLAGQVVLAHAGTGVEPGVDRDRAVGHAFGQGLEFGFG